MFLQLSLKCLDLCFEISLLVLGVLEVFDCICELNVELIVLLSCNFKFSILFLEFCLELHDLFCSFGFLLFFR